VVDYRRYYEGCSIIEKQAEGWVKFDRHGWEKIKTTEIVSIPGLRGREPKKSLWKLVKNHPRTCCGNHRTGFCRNQSIPPKIRVRNNRRESF
jgi:hypothetical protein